MSTPIRLDAFLRVLNGLGVEVQSVAEEMIDRYVWFDSGERTLSAVTVEQTQRAIERAANNLIGEDNPTKRRALLLTIAGYAAVLLAADECDRGEDVIEEEMERRRS